MLVSYLALNKGHYNTVYCRAGAVRVRQRHALANGRRAREIVFTVNGEDRDQVSVFKYFGRPISSFDSDWIAVYHKLKRARMRWMRVSRVLSREGADSRVCGMFCKAVVQSELLYSCETRVITSQVLDALEGFHHRVARRLNGKRPYFPPQENRWVYPPIEKALEEAGLFSVEHVDSTNNLLTIIVVRPSCEKPVPLAGIGILLLSSTGTPKADNEQAPR